MIRLARSRKNAVHEVQATVDFARGDRLLT
jgi:hypothetical protein